MAAGSRSDDASEGATSTWFNGGKLEHVFKTKKDGRNVQYIPEFTSPEAKACFEDEGTVWFLKVHGENGMLVADEDKGAWVVYLRRDNYKPSSPDVRTMPLPPGQQPDTYSSGVKEHHYIYVRLEDAIQAKPSKKEKVVNETLAAVRNAVEAGFIPSVETAMERNTKYISFEWIGKKHQGNVYGLECDHAIAPHHLQFIMRAGKATFEAIADSAKREQMEGVVLKSKTGKYYKIRYGNFPDSAWAKTSRISKDDTLLWPKYMCP
jgi:hypothetical protein